MMAGPTGTLNWLMCCVPCLVVWASFSQPASAGYNKRGFLVVAMTDSMVSLPALVADRKGFWKAEGLYIKTRMEADFEDLLDRMTSRWGISGKGSNDLAVARAGDVACQRAAGVQLVPVAVVGDDVGQTRIVVRTVIGSIKGLKGRKVACDRTTANLYFLSEALKKSGLTLEDVTVVDLHGMNNPRVFLAGEVDAIVIDSPGAAECVAKANGKEVLTSVDVPGLLRQMLFIKSWVLDNNPYRLSRQELMDKLTRAYAKAQAWVEDPKNERELAKIVDNWLYFLKYKHGAKPLDAAFVRGRLEGWELVPAVPLGAADRSYMTAAGQFFVHWRRVFGLDKARAADRRGPKRGAETFKLGGKRRSTFRHDVRDYGAVGDGVADDTDAIQKAIDACIEPGVIRGWNAASEKRGWRNGGTVYIPQGMYRTTRPIRLRSGIAVIGDESALPLIESEAEVGVVFWKGPWNDRKVDFKVRTGANRRCTGVTLKNIWVRAKRFGGHTMGVHANALRMERCRWEGPEAGFVCSGFMMMSQIRNCYFERAVWFLCQGGTRLNTTTIEKIQIGLHGTRNNNWAIRMEGCIQCIRLSDVLFEVQGRGIYLDANRSGVTIDINNVWNYDTGGPSEVLRIVNGDGISVRNVMGIDHPSTIFVGKGVRNIRFENVKAKSITFEDARATRPILSNVSATRRGDKESMIEDDMGAPK